MNGCVCGTCKNLKSIIDENEEVENSINEICEFGFPSEDCYTCELDGCELTCAHYENDVVVDAFIVTSCKKCGKEIKLMAKNKDDADQFCITCYLNKA